MNIALKNPLRRNGAREVEALVDDMQALRREVASLMSRLKEQSLGETAGAVREKGDDVASGLIGRIGSRIDAGAVVDRISDRAARLGDQASSLYESFYRDAAKRGRRAVRAVNRHMQERPRVGLLAAFCAGLLLTQFLSGRRE
jgi:ElaB/YqjD/DUF883 family membrane-anchored ribosome-binding protein